MACEILAGTLNFKNREDGTVYAVKKVFKHPKWPEERHNIGLVLTKTEIRFTAKVNMIPIAPLNTEEGHIVEIDGWGRRGQDVNLDYINLNIGYVTAITA